MTRGNCVPEVTKGDLLGKGKTKFNYAVSGDPTGIIHEASDDITRFDDPSKTKNFPGKGRCSNLTTSAIFELLKQADVPVSYRYRLSDTELVADKCRMIPLEVIGRRFILPASSYLKRHPGFLPAGAKFRRFHRLVTEFYLKTTGGKLAVDGMTLLEGLKKDDPFITDPDADRWQLRHPGLPIGHPDAVLSQSIDRDKVVTKAQLREMRTILRKLFLVLEGTWHQFGYHLADIKVEFGITTDGRLVVADVVDNDSWRLPDINWIDMSKQTFRDDAPMETVIERYLKVASMASHLRIPRQALVIWRGSANDQLPDLKLPFNRLGIGLVDDVVFSGHKETMKALRRLNRLQGEFPDGGVIIDIVGRSNGLGPTLAAHTTWPVISFPATYKEFSDDIHSSTRMPSSTPNLTAWPFENCLQAAMNILAQKNPLAYAYLQEKIEELDSLDE